MTSASLDAALADFAATVGDEGPIAVAGGRTRWTVGGEPVESTRVVAAPTGIYAYEPAEMTVSVGAGTEVAALHRELAQHGQRTALPERGGTVGGAIAVGENDYRALGRGFLRDSVLRVRYVSSDGRVVSGGGPTVKNVSGFDLPRLIVGSLGRLGLIAEVTLRTNPILPHMVWVSGANADPRAVLDTLLAPSCVLWNGSHTWVQIEGDPEDVAAQCSALENVGAFEPVDGPPTLPPHRWSLSPKDALRPDTAWGDFVSAVGVGLVYASRARAHRELDPTLATIQERLKRQFDPKGRLNPRNSAEYPWT